MKVLAFNSSPKMERGNTALILDPFLEGMGEAGADVELFYTRKLKINPCRGDLICCQKTPGVCWQKDDMQMLLPKFAKADIQVFATPVYCYGVTGSMKDLLDRRLPLVQPFFELRDGHSRHSLRDGAKRSKVVLVSNCGLWEMDSFDPLLVHIQAICENAAMEFAGALLRPHGEALRKMMEMGASLSDIFEAAKKAGHQLVREGKISADTLATVSREIVPLELYVQGANRGFKQASQALED